MKYLLVLVVLMVAFWVWRNNRHNDLQQRKDNAPARPGLPVPMVACLQCGTHLPETEAVKGPHGRYCSLDHRQAHERTLS